jgi:hypothetical protein
MANDSDGVASGERTAPAWSWPRSAVPLGLTITSSHNPRAKQAQVALSAVGLPIRKNNPMTMIMTDITIKSIDNIRS